MVGELLHQFFLRETPISPFLLVKKMPKLRLMARWWFLAGLLKPFFPIVISNFLIPVIGYDCTPEFHFKLP